MQIVAFGGGAFVQDARYVQRPGPLMDHVLALTGAERPKITGIFTATGDDLPRIASFLGAFAGTTTRASHLALFPMPNVHDVRAHLLSQDAIFVGGGSTANLLAVWRTHRLDELLREAWEAGVVLSGGSAGSLCWFRGGTTDSYGPELVAINDGLGFLPASHCPHYSSEPGRRPLYQRLVGTGSLPPGWAADDGVGLHFVGTELQEVVAGVPGAAAYFVEPTGDGHARETTLEPRLLVS